MNLFAWILVGVTCLTLELIVPGTFFFVAWGIGVIGALVASFLGLSTGSQAAVWLITSLILFFSIARLINRHNYSRSLMGKITTNTERLIGLTGVVIEPVEPQTPGQVRVGGDVWRARPQQAEEVFVSGEVVRVVRVQGTTIFIKKESTIEIS